MAQLALDEAHELKPQSTPGITPRPLIRRMIDRTMLAALLKRWPERYATETPSWEDTALFRSLNMANAAAKLPANAEGTYYDIGRSVALWVSAFEILVHSGSSGLFKVYDNFDKAEWNLTKCKERKYEAYGYKEGEPLRNLACWIYGKIHQSRNDFLHGNPITSDTLVVPQSDRPLLQYAPTLPNGSHRISDAQMGSTRANRSIGIGHLQFPQIRLRILPKRHGSGTCDSANSAKQGGVMPLFDRNHTESDVPADMIDVANFVYESKGS
jgi:hypothetical protein